MTSLKGLDEWLVELSTLRYMIVYKSGTGIFISLLLLMSQKVELTRKNLSKP